MKTTKWNENVQLTYMKTYKSINLMTPTWVTNLIQDEIAKDSEIKGHIRRAFMTWGGRGN